MEAPVGVGVIGCGTISPAYLEGCRPYDILEVVACADLHTDRAEARAAEFQIPRACTVEELLADDDVQIVLNLTVPKAHTELNLAAIEAGKSVYSEKPLAVRREEGQQIVAAARAARVGLACAPDTFLGGGLQTCRKVIDEGRIGEPIAATACTAGRGSGLGSPELDFFFQVGGGPMFDMGPYYLTALFNLLGPIRRVTGSAKISAPERVVTADTPRRGERVPVEISTHVTGVLDFASGAVGTVMASFDVWGHHQPPLEIYGSEGTLSVPRPDRFGGQVLLRRPGAEGWEEIPLTHSADVSRGIGVADLAYALCHGRPPRASGDMAYHILDVMQAFEDASRTCRHVEIESQCERPAPLPVGLLPGTLDP